MGDEFDYSGFDSGMDFGNLDLGNLDLGNLDLGNINFEDLNLGDLSNLDLSGTDLSDLDLSRLIDQSNLDTSGMGDLQGSGQFNLDDLLGGGGDESNLTRSLTGGTEAGARNPLEGLRISGRGQLSGLPSETGTGITGEGFSSITDLLRSGTPEEIARYTPGTADYALHSGLEGDPFSFKADATQGANLTSMGGGQGITKYVPAKYTDNGDLMPGTGGTLTELGFIPDKGSRVAIGDPKSWINNPAKTGEKAIVSQDNVVRTDPNTGKAVVTTATGQTPVVPGDNKSLIDQIKSLIGGGSGSQNQQNDWMKYLMMLMALDAMRNKGDNQAVIPRLSGERSQTPYAAIQQAAGYRPGQGGIKYFSDVTRKAAGGGIGSLAGVGSVDSAGGRLLRGPGDGVSDSIKAQIGDHQPARLADGEYVLDARTVSEIGNGSTEAGAKKLAAMVARIQQSRRHAKRGKPSNADKHLLA